MPPAEEVAELLDQRHRALAEQAEQLQSSVRNAREVDQLCLIEYHYRLGLIEAEQRFIERFRGLILHGGATFGQFWRQFHAGESPDKRGVAEAVSRLPIAAGSSDVRC